MTAAATKRKAPRKAAEKDEAAQAPESDSAALAAPERHEPKAPQHPYGDRKIFVFSPIDGSPDIIFPSISTVDTDAHFFWTIYRKNEMFQAFEWMDKAGVPRDIQERVMLLPDGEKGRFFSGWFSDITAPQGVAPPGES